jgi:gluconolactonase
MKTTAFYLLYIIILSISCTSPEEQESASSTSDMVEQWDSNLSQLLSDSLQIDVLSEGYEWSEGPLWVEPINMLLFTDVPSNTIYAWHPDKGTSIYLQPSGYTDTLSRGGEPGANGLALSSEGSLILCQHGDRRIAKMTAPLEQPAPEFTTLASTYNQLKFNSPNDLVISRNGTIYFTDPPYGLEKNMDDPKKETPYQGVYRILSDGTVELLVDSLTRPNGIALSPDETTLYIANSDPEKAYWVQYKVSENGLQEGVILFDATEDGAAGSPDGMTIDAKGNIFATGPGGIWIFSPQGIRLGRIRLPQNASNCTLSPESDYLYITADHQLLGIRLR